MSKAELFAVTISAVFMGLTLFSVMLWGLVSYSRMEREGTHLSKDGWRAFFTALIPMAAAAFITFAAFDKLPDWVNYALQ